MNHVITTKKKHAEWLIMVYLAADDVLANFAMTSVKQLSRVQNPKVITVALLGVDELEIHNLYAFEGKVSPKSEGKVPPNSLGLYQKPWKNGGFTDPATLTAFLDEVHKDYEAKNYCLVLWGHGPELLYEGPRGKRKAPDYFTPAELRKAITKSKLHSEKKEGREKALDIIAMDACSMSMFEYAYELKDVATYMIASQEEVSDQSFPYERMLQPPPAPAHFPSNPLALCESAAEVYIDNYQGCFYQIQTGLRPATISILNLEKAEFIATRLGALVDLLVAAPKTEEEAILAAREQSQGFVGGLFVDLYDFCEKLEHELLGRGLSEGNLKKACDVLKTALDGVENEEHKETGLAPKKNNNRFIQEKYRIELSPDERAAEHVKEKKLGFKPESCHGLSIYFPYLTHDEQDYIDNFQYIKGVGGPAGAGGTGKRSVEIANLAATSISYASRWQVIENTEEYYHNENFEFAQNTNWDYFIRYKWSRILTEHCPKEFHLRYSAEQCARNLLNPGKLRPKINKKAA